MSSSLAAAWAWAPSWNVAGRHVPAITPASWPVSPNIGWGTADPAEREETPAGDAVRCRGPADLGRLRPVAGSPPDVGDVRDRLPDRPGPGHASRGHQHRPAHHHAAATGEQRQPGSRE